MNRLQKEAFVSSFQEGIDKAQAMALLSFNKLDVEQMTSFRLSLRKKDIRVKVVKNTLAKRVFENTPYKSVISQFEGPTLVVYSAGDPVVTAKAIAEWTSKENIEMKFKAGAAMGQLLSDAQLRVLAKLPGKKELFVNFLWALKSPQTGFLYALQDPPRRLGYALGAFKAKKEKEAAA